LQLGWGRLLLVRRTSNLPSGREGIVCYGLRELTAFVAVWTGNTQTAFCRNSNSFNSETHRIGLVLSYHDSWVACNDTSRGYQKKKQVPGVDFFFSSLRRGPTIPRNQAHVHI